MKKVHHKIRPSIEMPEDPARRRHFLGIESSATRFLKNTHFVAAAAKNVVPFGLPFLDASILGLLPTGLAGIGAKGGVGKTQIVLEMAKNMAMKKRRVLFVALEAEQNEIELRLEFQLFASKWYYDTNKDPNIVFDYRRFRYGELSKTIRPYADEVKEIYHSRYETLETMYKLKDFTIENLRQLMLYARKDGVNCIIIDHLMYFDLFGGEPENTEMAGLMKDIRDLNLHYNIPVILVAHTRKTQSNLPGLEDFRGTSDIGKIITDCVMIAPRPGSYDPVSGTIDTIISVPKARAGGALNVVGLMRFHTQLQCYLPEYRVATYSHDNIEELERSRLPYWAKRDSFCVNGNSPLEDQHY